MFRHLRRRLNNERGAITVMIGLLMISLLALLALGIDVGMLFTAHSEAQRAADAGALAGASEFFNATPDSVQAIKKARGYAGRNSIQGVMIDSTSTSEVQVWVFRTDHKVRVRVTRSVPTWFARLIGIPTMTISAVAAAQVFDAGKTQCLKPLAVPDLWSESTSDANGNRVWDGTEDWTFDPGQGDYYLPYTGGTGIATDGRAESGYGGPYRDATGIIKDYGRPLQLKEADPNSPYVPRPGVFLPLQIPISPNQGTCTHGGGGTGTTGGAVYRQNLCACNDSPVSIGDSLHIETGDMVGPTFQGVGDLVSQDPGATWNPTYANADGTLGRVENSNQADWHNSPRLVKMALVNPTQVANIRPGDWLKIANFALFFIESQQNTQAPVIGRFVTYVPGDVGPTQNSPLVKTLKLVE